MVYYPIIDGIPIVNTELSGDISNNHPPVDAIGQFKLINNNQSAQYGFSSGVVAFAFNSGTNAFHGSLFENLQNDALDANGYDNNKLGQPKSPLKQNEYGGTFGGPVWLPKLYNGRDKTFFFVDYTGFSFRPSSLNAALTTFPNPFRAGNFAPALGGPLTDDNGPTTKVAIITVATRVFMARPALKVALRKVASRVSPSGNLSSEPRPIHAPLGRSFFIGPNR